MRVGIGYDIHRLVTKRKLFLGGIEIAHAKGLKGHSDGDVVIHAIADAILGALSLGDIGEHFPNTDMKYKDAPSGIILKKVSDMMTAKKFAINNIDTVIIAEEPKISPFRNKMTSNIAEILDIKKDSVSIKATTNEGIGAIGRGEAIAAYAIVGLEKKNEGGPR